MAGWKATWPYFSHAMVFRPAEDGQLTFVYVGKESPAARVYGSEWAAASEGHEHDGHSPDRDYSSRVCRPYTAVLESGEPRLDHIRALIHRHVGEPLWAPYQRLLAPCKLRDGSPVLVCLSDLTQQIAIPFMNAP